MVATAQRPGLRELRLDGARLAFHESGPASGEPVVLLHGYPSNHRIWRHQIRALEDDFRVIAPDLLGWGASERPLGLRFDYETEVGRLGRLLDALELDRASLIAHDYGGFLSLGLAQSSPERVARLAILNSRSHRTFVPRWYATFGLFSVAGRVPGLRALATRLPLAAINRRGLAPLRRRGVVDDDLLDSYLGWMEEPEGRRWLLHFFGEYRVAARRELAAGLGEIACPAAIVWGERDAYLSTRIARELADGIPGAELTLIPGAGHFVPEEAPDEVKAALMELLAR